MQVGHWAFLDRLVEVEWGAVRVIPCRFAFVEFHDQLSSPLRSPPLQPRRSMEPRGNWDDACVGVVHVQPHVVFNCPPCRKTANLAQTASSGPIRMKT